MVRLETRMPSCAESHRHARRTNRLGYRVSKALDALPNGSAQTEGEVAEHATDFVYGGENFKSCSWGKTE
jgi:hypothetical protein